jgi:hypothetical protein
MQVLFLLFLVTFVSASPLSEVSKIVLSEQLKDNFLFNRKIFSQEGQQVCQHKSLIYSYIASFRTHYWRRSCIRRTISFFSRHRNIHSNWSIFLCWITNWSSVDSNGCSMYRRCISS